MTISNHYTPDQPIHVFFHQRFSPYSFSNKPINQKDLQAIFEAARFAPSCFNEQPWRYLIATQGNPLEFEKILKCLVPGNQEWAKFPFALAIGIAKENFTLNDKPNAPALHDLGTAGAYLTFEAHSRGLFVHQMAGILPEEVKKSFSIPEGFRPLTGLAIGYLGTTPQTPQTIIDRDKEIKPRKALQDIVFSGQWETPFNF